MDDRHYYHCHNYGGVPVLPASPQPTASAPAAAMTWPCFLPSQEEEGELRHALVATAAELESTRSTAAAELRRMEGQALRLAELLDLAVRERDEARAHCQSLLLHMQQHNSVHQITAEEGTILADSPEQGSSNVLAAAEAAVLELAAGRRKLPEKGRLVEAVMSAGPLLQTLQLAGALPEWNRPPPPLPAVQIPPVNMDLMQQQKRPKISRPILEINDQDDEVVVVHRSSSSSSPESNGGGGS